MKSYPGGVHFANLPMSALIAKCWRPKLVTKVNIYSFTLKALATSPYSNSAITNIQVLRESVIANKCNQTLTATQWLALTDIMLKNSKYKSNAENYIRVERANLFIEQRNFERTMQELEMAFAASPSIELTQKIAEVLLSAGLYNDAENWLRKGIALKKPWFKEWLSSDKEKSFALLALIEKSKRK